MIRPAPDARRILVVDDDEHTRSLVRDLCEQSGYRVSQAADGVEALETIRAGAPDLVLLDLMMPHKDGFAVLKELRADPATRELPVILITAIGEMDGKIRGMELGADDYVTKPFKMVELQTRVASALLVREYRQRLAAAEDQLTELRAVDPLTGAGTYAQLKASLDGELARSKRYGRPAAALLIVIEEFNDFRFQLGREKCDEYLAAMTQRVRDTLRAADRLFRLDADQFVALLPETDLRGAKLTAERLARVTRDVAGEGRQGPVFPRVRIAGASYPDERVETGEELLREANRRYQVLRDSGSDKTIFDA